MTVKVYVLAERDENNINIKWFKSVELALKLIRDDWDIWGGNEATGPMLYEFPDGFDFRAAGILFSDLEFEEDNDEYAEGSVPYQMMMELAEEMERKEK